MPSDLLMALVLSLLPVGTRSTAAIPATTEVIAQEVRAACDAFAKLGASTREEPDVQPNRKLLLFCMPDTTDDESLTRLPNPPCPFGLSLCGTLLTDTGLS